MYLTSIHTDLDPARFGRIRTDRGATMVEYAILVVVLGAALVAAWSFFGDALDSSAQDTGSVIQNVNEG